MQGYTKWWSSIWGAVTLLGVLVGFLVWPATAVAAIVLLVAVFAAVGCTAYYRANPDRSVPGGSLARTSGAHGLAVGVTAVGAMAVGTVSGALLLLLLVAASATSPWAIRAIGGAGWSPRQGVPPAHENVRTEPLIPSVPEQGVVSALPSSVRTLSDAELCRAWRVSFGALDVAGTAVARARVVELRQSYLDEIERRHPTGLAAWLSSGARAAGNPTKYLAPGEQRRAGD